MEDAADTALEVELVDVVDVALDSGATDADTDAASNDKSPSRRKTVYDVLSFVVMCAAFVLAIFFISRVLTGSSRYGVPGIAMRSHEYGSTIMPYVDELVSRRHPDQPLPYYRFFPMCRPTMLYPTSESFGEMLLNTELSNSDLYFVTNQSDAVQTCKFTFRDARELTRFQDAVHEDYRAVWVVDGRPSFEDVGANASVGFPIGEHERRHGTYSLYDVYHVTFYYVPATSSSLYIVGNQVRPRHAIEARLDAVYNISYKVTWVELNAEVEDGAESLPYPWDATFLFDPRARLVSFGSLALSASLCVAVALTLLVLIVRRVRADVRHVRNSTQPPDRWNIVVERALMSSGPQWARSLLTATLLAGLHLALVLIGTSWFGALGFFYLNRHGEVIQTAVYLYASASLPVAAIGGHCYRSRFSGRYPLVTALVTANIVPVVSALIMLPTTISLHLRQSRGALSWIAWTWLACAYGVTLVATALTFMAFYLKSEPGSAVLNRQRKFHTEPDRKPTSRWQVSSIPVAMLLGAITFIVVAIPLTYLIQAMWSPRVDTMYVALALSVALWFVVDSVVAILYAFLMLNGHSYRLWWYKLFWAIGIPPAIYAFLFALLCFLFALDIRSLLSTAIYFSYVLLFSTLGSIMLGSVGVLVAYAFFYMAHRAIVLKDD